MWCSQGFCFLIRLVVLIEFFFELGSVGELLAVALIHFFPNVSELIPEIMLEIVSMDIESFVVVDEILQFEQILNVFNLILYGQLFFFYSGLQLLPLRKVDQVNDHVSEIVRHISFSESLNYLPEDSV